MKNFLVLISGLLFGFGLSLSQMINPTVVLNFLDVFGTWDASLMFVMIGALAVTTITFHFLLKKEKPLCEIDFHLPNKKHLDKSLLIGAMLFGIGWGLAGYCPGPAIAGIILGQIETFWFVGAMVVGMKLSQVVKSRNLLNNKVEVS
jgi:uncharacterized membrane protein YedE/YeeE